VVEIPIGDDGIRLGQLLKLANLVDSGGQARALLASGAVLVNAEVETRRGRHLVAGDLVEYGGQRLTLTRDR
jgi:ribosome-associated protein